MIDQEPATEGFMHCLLRLGTLAFAALWTSVGAFAQEWHPPSFVAEPSAQTVGGGMSAVFSATVGGNPPPTLQWFFNGSAVPFATNATLVLGNVQTDRAGYYWVTASNPFGQLSSRPVQLTVTNRAPQVSPVLLVEPLGKPQPFQPGESLVLRCDATGSAPIVLQWFHDGVPVPAGTNATLALANATYADTGAYSLVASNAHGVAFSTKLFVSVSSLVVVGTGIQVPTNIPPRLGDVKALAVGHYHVLAVDAAGQVFTWNNGPNGATNLPANLGPAKAVAAAGFSGMALLESGRVVAWSPSPNSNAAFTNVPTSVTSVVAIASADSAGLALRGDGSVVAWGSSAFLPPPPALSNIVAITASPNHAAALQNDGRVVAWGNPSFTIVPVSLSDAIALSATAGHTLALRENGTVVAWGQAPPVPPQATNIVAIAAGSMVNLALRADGRLILWGSASNQLAGQTAALSNVVAIAASHRSSFYAAAVGNGAPRITLHPHGQELPDGCSIRLHGRVVGRQPMSYQWHRNGQPIPGANSPTLILDRQRGSQPGLYWLVASNELGSIASDAAAVTVRYTGTLGQALNAPEVTWRNAYSHIPEQFSSNAWMAQIDESYDGQGSARSGSLSHGGAVTLRTSIPGPGRVSFRWKVSSEEAYDWLAFSNWTQSGNLSATLRISGETDWKLETIDLPIGLNQLTWSYNKDIAVSAGQDAGWIDTVVFTPAPPVFTGWLEGITTYPNHEELIRVAISSMTPATFTWLFNGVPLSNLTGGTNLLRAPDQPSTNSFRIIISNSVGQTSTEEYPFVVRATPLLQKPILEQDGLRLRLGWPDGGPMVSIGSYRFRLQTSTNLVDWEPLDVWGVVTNGLLEYNAPLDEPSSQRFYRLTP
jgi:hypothetical protein